MATSEIQEHLAELGGPDAIRERLLTRRGEIMAMYEHDVRAGQEAADEGSDDIVDRANNAYNRELMFSLSDGERTTLLRIEEALDRIDQGLYGVCANCERSIGSGRLKAMLWAYYCINCQELSERGMLDP